MSRRQKIYLFLIGITLIGIVYAELSKPRQINWFPSYTSHHKIPFGAYIFKDLVKKRFDSIVTVDRPPYEFLNQHDVTGTYLFFNDGLRFGPTELEFLLDWTSAGNTLILASTDFEYSVLDTLKIETDIASIPGNFNNEFQVALTHPDLRTDEPMVFDRGISVFHFTEMDSSQTKVVGILDKYEESKEQITDTLVNVIKQSFGKGEIILSTFPQAFTNYFILTDTNRDYTAGLMSYIDPEQPLYLDAYYKSGKSFYTSPLYLFLNNPNLKWAYYIMLIAVVVYIIFEGKRKQRAIPVVKPLKNRTVDYTRTIANMYYERSSHGEIARHKIQHFLSFIRINLYLQTSSINEEFYNQLAARSNNDLEEVKQLFAFIKKLEQQDRITKEELERLNTLIENFKSNNQWKTKI